MEEAAPPKRNGLPEIPLNGSALLAALRLGPQAQQQIPSGLGERKDLVLVEGLVHHELHLLVPVDPGPSLALILLTIYLGFRL